MVFTCKLFRTLSMDMQLGAHHNEIASRPEAHARCARAASDRTDVIARSCLRLAQPSPELVCLALTKAAAAALRKMPVFLSRTCSFQLDEI